MRSNYLMNCLWYEDIPPEQAAQTLKISPEEFYDKVFGNKQFTLDEIRELSALLGLTDEEIDMVFFGEDA